MTHDKDIKANTDIPLVLPNVCLLPLLSWNENTLWHLCHTLLVGLEDHSDVKKRRCKQHRTATLRGVSYSELGRVIKPGCSWH